MCLLVMMFCLIIDCKNGEVAISAILCLMSTQILRTGTLNDVHIILQIECEHRYFIITILFLTSETLKDIGRGCSLHRHQPRCVSPSDSLPCSHGLFYSNLLLCTDLSNYCAAWRMRDLERSYKYCGPDPYPAMLLVESEDSSSCE